MYETEHFKYGTSDKLACPCGACGNKGLKRPFLDVLEAARVRANIPFRITSGYRCESYQDLLRSQGYETANGTSPHSKGVAVDIGTKNGEERFAIIRALLTVGFNRLGIGSNFLHVDMDRDRLSKYIWHYKR